MAEACKIKWKVCRPNTIPKSDIRMFTCKAPTKRGFYRKRISTHQLPWKEMPLYGGQKSQISTLKMIVSVVPVNLHHALKPITPIDIVKLMPIGQGLRDKFYCKTI